MTDLKNSSIARILNVSKRVLKQITRDHRTFGMLLIMPMVVMFIFGVALSGEVKNVPVVVQNLDEGFSMGPISLDKGSELVTVLNADDRLDVTDGEYQAGINSVERGDYKASILIPITFSEAIFNSSQNLNSSIVLYVYIDGTKSQTEASVFAAIQEAIKDSMGAVGIEIDVTYAFNNADYSGLDTAIPAVMAYVLNFLVLLISLLILIRERVEGTQYRLLSTPLTSKERLVGYIIALTIFAMLEAGSILSISIFVFHVPIQGSLGLLLFIMIIYALNNVLFAVFMSNFAQNELQAVQMAPLIALPSLAISGLMVPVSSLPAVIQPLSSIIPLTYAIRIFEGIMLKGWGVELILYDLIIIIGITLIFLIIAFFTVKDTEE
ncbi:MAG: ABC-2 transporter permease [Candidatus Heimdallarchaeota archaeon]|nr:ABC-2 transporter permease [Candidatus Heimdallarchaeota archaeon]MDH5645572.1 ABC-2 transporter permease [Candidatus Heimdallarchaeota archaeon]